LLTCWVCNEEVGVMAPAPSSWHPFVSGVSVNLLPGSHTRVIHVSSIT
jgi:hypothetical protein